MIGSRGEGADPHQRRFLFGQGLVTQNHLRQVLGLPGGDPAVRAESELARHCAVDAVDLHLKATGDLFGRKARDFTLRLARRRVFPRGDQSCIDVTVNLGSSPQLISGRSALPG